MTDCHPCRVSPGPGQPAFDLTFVFQGTGDQKALTGFDLVPLGGGQPLHLAVGPLAVSDFPDGFTIDTTDLNFDRLGDLSIITQEAADNTDAAYWIYDPATKSFLPLERLGDDGSEVLLSPGPDHRLHSEVRGSMVEYADYTHQVSGHRAVAVAEDSQEIDHALIVDVTYDLTVKTHPQGAAHDRWLQRRFPRAQCVPKADRRCGNPGGGAVPGRLGSASSSQ